MSSDADPIALARLPFDLEPGAIVAGKYRIDRVLGRGGMGIVVAATHEHLDQQVALKFLLPEIKSAEIVQRFLREARASVKIQSEHVARVFDVGTLETGSPYIVMEYLHGDDLSNLLRMRGALPVEEAVDYVLQAAEAVAEAHALGIIHRDLKPANLFLATRSNGRPLIKVLDFGISKIPTTTAEAAMTGASTMMGSPLYMSPEQMVAARDVDARSDIWSLGVVLFQLLTGELPFNAESMTEIVAAVLSVPPRPISELRPSTPAGLQSIVLKCLEKDPARRYASLAQLARALAPFAPATGSLSAQRIDHVAGESTGPERPSAADPNAQTGWAEYRIGQPASPGFAGATPPGTSPSLAQSGSTSVVTSRTKTSLVLVMIGLAWVVAAVVGFAWYRHLRPPEATAAGATSASAPSTSPPPPLPSSQPQPPATSILPIAQMQPVGVPTASTELAASAAPVTSAPVHTPGSHAHPAPSSSAGGSTACHTEAYFDSDGNKHFKQVCP